MTVTTFAAIDIGSYEVCMKIFELSRKNGFRELNHVRYRLEIGKGAYSSGRLEQGMVDAICERLKDFRNMMLEFGVTEYRACSTSAFREMVNPVIILEQIYQRTGIRVEILSNAEQHFLGYKSIAAIESGFKKIIQKGTAILDVGGGGLQVSLFDKDTLVTTQSLKMGSMRIRERLKELEKANTHYDQLIREFIRNDLTAFQRLYLKDRDIKNVILMGDFLTDTIFREEIYDHIITMSEFTARYEDTVYKTDQMLAAEMDIDPEYASLVVPTMVICKSFLDVFQAEAVWVPGVSLLDGIAYDFCEKKKYITEIIAGLLEVSDRGARGILAGLVEKQMRFILWKGKKDIPQKAALLGRKVKRASREAVPFLFAYRGVRRHERQTFYTKFLEFARFL